MKKVIRLTESDLIRLVKRVINEQRIEVAQTTDSPPEDQKALKKILDTVTNNPGPLGWKRARGDLWYWLSRDNFFTLSKNPSDKKIYVSLGLPYRDYIDWGSLSGGQVTTPNAQLHQPIVIKNLPLVQNLQTILQIFGNPKKPKPAPPRPGSSSR